ncbi:cation:proton antiporter [Sphingomonas rubra]|uniref:Monovalent cation:H+ antiporter, CPA1 family n=1 Tax=Sphingomonas rubra TaxID=634430 RepID=A0A1I5TAU2_9SPHN|nr:sodium:proton antiporter [Sphingomonas rubra]SFP80140.1 monovalent cation:H+ antiporter, CPA1 family [Sphingomonas rubra]
MIIFDTILLLLFGAALLSILAGRIGVPYPTLLALGGVALALIPGTPRLDLPPDLILALFVAPVLLDAAHDTSLRDLRANWRPVLSLVLVAVGLTTIAVAVVTRVFLPDMPWAAAIALGALLAPPDAVAALAVMRSVAPPHRIRSILEGESLLNDASSLLVYNLAVAAVAVGAFRPADAVPAFALVTVGSVVVGWVLAKLVIRLTAPIDHPAIATIIQFVTTFGVWILAERLELSGVVTIVVFGLTAGRRSSSSSHTSVRVLSFATWETLTLVLNVLAFTMIGLQLRPILDRLDGGERATYPLYALAILGVVIIVRLAWVLFYGASHRLSRKPDDALRSWAGTLKSGVLVGWSGMRGIVTLAAALAVPEGFPYRDFILLVAFVVVLGTLVIQGLTLKPLLRALRFPADTIVSDEMATARAGAIDAAMRTLDNNASPAAERLRQEYREALGVARAGDDPRGSSDNTLRQRMIPASRHAIDTLRAKGTIGDEAYRAVEEELDWLELSSRPSASA